MLTFIAMRLRVGERLNELAEKEAELAEKETETTKK
jgi:hypothetical protein